jgi:superfamily II DNA or RNA helicase
MELELREHQLDVIDALRDGFKKGHRSQLLYAPTGFGKTEVAIYLMKATAEKYNRAAIMMDRLVLVNQTSERLLKYGLQTWCLSGRSPLLSALRTPPGLLSSDNGGQGQLPPDGPPDR